MRVENADPALEDLTAKARIRDATLRMFAECGMDAATIRDILGVDVLSPAGRVRAGTAAVDVPDRADQAGHVAGAAAAGC